MRVTPAIVRGICATATLYLPEGDGRATLADLHRALGMAIHRRHGSEGLSQRQKRRLRSEALAVLPAWQPGHTCTSLAGELEDAAREGLDLTTLIGQRYTEVAGRVWFHGAYSPVRVTHGLPALTLRAVLSSSGRPWLNLWTGSEAGMRATVVAAQYAATT